MIEGQFNIDQGESVFEPEIQENPGCPVRIFEHAIGRVMLAGHCLSPDDEVMEVLDKAAASENDTYITYLAGSYATVITRPDRTTLFSDVSGQFPFYFTRKAEQVLYGTQLDAVAAHASGMPDKIGLALEITGAYALNRQLTRYEGVHRLPAAHRLDLAHDQAIVAPYDSLAPSKDTSFERAAEDLRVALHDAIAGRLALHKQISGDFSGGLDSTSLAFLTLAQLPQDARLHAFHHHIPESPSGDLVYARRFAEMDRRIALHLVELPKQPYNFDAGTPLLPPRARLSHIKTSGSELHLDGTGADALFNIPGSYLYDMWNTEGIRGLSNLLPSLIGRARLTNENPLEGLRKILARLYTSHEEIITEAARVLEEGGLPSESQLGINGRALGALSLNMRKQIAASMMSGTSTHEVTGYADRMAINELWASGSASGKKRKEAEEHGVSVHFPFLDHRVIRASMQLAGYKRQRPHQFKALLHEALQGTVPDELLARRSKGSYSTEAYVSIRDKAHDFKDLLSRNSLLARLGIMDHQAVHQIIVGIELSAPDALLSVPQHAAEVEKWLQSRYKAPPTPSGPRPVQSASEADALPTFPVSLAPHVRAVEDSAGVTLYNLRTKELRSLHHAASAVIRMLHEHGQPEDIYEAVRQTLEPELRDQAEPLTAKIFETLIDRSFIEPQSSRRFLIAASQTSPHPQTSEIFYAENVTHSSEIKMSDYLAVINGIRRARALLDTADLYEITQCLGNIKDRQQWSDASRVKRLLHAGHVVGKYHMSQLTCQELSLAVVLAEAQKRRRVDWAMGVSVDPRGVHAWPEIDGEPVRTEYDDLNTGKYTKLDAW